MDNNIFEIVKLVLQIALLVLGAFVIPAVKKWLDANTILKQRESAEYWVPIIIREAEKKFVESQTGPLKKAWVIEWLNNNGVKITEDQANILIDTVVEYFNVNGWNVEEVV